MIPRPTDHANLDLLELHRAVIRGKSDGKIIWQPRIGCWLTDKQFESVPLPEPYEGQSLPEIYRSLGCSSRLYPFNACFKKIEDPRVHVSHEQLSETDALATVETPVGKQTSVTRKHVTNRRLEHLKWEVADEEEMKVAIWRGENTAWEWDQAAYDRLWQEWGPLGLPTMYIPRVTVQDLYLNIMGVEQAIFAMHDYPGTVEAHFRALDDCHDRMIDVVNESPIEIVNFGDNLHGGTLSPDLFERYVLPAYQRRCERLHAAGKFVHAHWDGDTRSLLPYAKETGLDGIEAITPVPQGDVTLEQIKDGLGDDLFLIDGLPAIYFDEMFPVSVLEECTRRVIELFAPKLILGISDEISSTGDIERIRVVGEIVDDYNARV